MNTTRDLYARKRDLRRLYLPAVVLVCSCATVALAAKPRDPLPTPLYTFDSESPAVQGAVVGSNDVLAVDQSAPSVFIPGTDLDLLLPEDVIDALSANRLIAPGETFVLLFSVDRNTIGTAPPDAELLAADVVFNALNQAAGDQCLSTTLFTLSGPFRDRASRANNNTLIVNNYNEGGTEFGASPYIPAAESNPMRAALDNVNSTATQPEPQGAGARQPLGLYFSLTALSPSLGALSSCGEISGATILYNATPGVDATGTYACFDQLGLTATDEIDGMIVIDVGIVGTYDAGDQVLFSLAPGSPFLGSDPGAAANVYSARFGESTVVFAPADAMGLGAAGDNIDALELLPCANAIDCAILHGIQGHSIPTLSGWGLLMMVALLLAAGIVVLRRHRPGVARATR